jgi:hypothetical protein
MERTGSTWQFMAVRQIYRAHGHSVDHVHTHSLQAIFDHELCVARNVTCIVKIHEYEPALLLLADYVLVSHRDPRDILMSVSQTFDSCLDYSRRTCPGNPDIGQLPKEPALDMTTHLSHYQKWRPVAHYDMKYELMMQVRRFQVVSLKSIDVVCTCRRWFVWRQHSNVQYFLCSELTPPTYSTASSLYPRTPLTKSYGWRTYSKCKSHGARPR